MARPSHRSVSQLTSWSRCSLAYFLSRELHLPAAPAAWFIQGTAVHAGIEAWEKSYRALKPTLVLDIYAQTWEQEEAAAKEKEPDLEAWQKSGVKKTEKDLQDRFIRGYEQLAAYMDVARKERLRPWTLPDTGWVASEVSFEEDFGHVTIKGQIDLIMQDPDTEALLVRDIKTGTKKPVGALQLAVYRHAIRKKYGVDPLWGDYWMCKDNAPTAAAPLWPYSEQLITAQFEAMDQAAQDELYLANIGEHCARCDVAKHCPFVGGTPPEGIPMLGT